MNVLGTVLPTELAQRRLSARRGEKGVSPLDTKLTGSRHFSRAQTRPRVHNIACVDGLARHVA